VAFNIKVGVVRVLYDGISTLIGGVKFAENGRSIKVINITGIPMIGVGIAARESLLFLSSSVMRYFGALVKALRHACHNICWLIITYNQNQPNHFLP